MYIYIFGFDIFQFLLYHLKCSSRLITLSSNGRDERNEWHSINFIIFPWYRNWIENSHPFGTRIILNVSHHMLMNSNEKIYLSLANGNMYIIKNARNRKMMKRCESAWIQRERTKKIYIGIGTKDEGETTRGVDWKSIRSSSLGDESYTSLVDVSSFDFQLEKSIRKLFDLARIHLHLRFHLKPRQSFLQRIFLLLLFVRFFPPSHTKKNVQSARYWILKICRDRSIGISSIVDEKFYWAYLACFFFFLCTREGGKGLKKAKQHRGIIYSWNKRSSCWYHIAKRVGELYFIRI